MDIAQRFPATQNYIYLNHAAMAPWPLDTEHALQRFVAENVRQGSMNYPAWSVLERELRTRLQTLIHAPSIEDIGLVHNTSVGISLVAEGIDWQAGDNIVSIAQEFPSNRYPWMSQAYRGVELRELDLTTCVDDPEAALLALCNENTRLVAISAVQFGNGLRMDIERIGKFCKAQDILFCVDGIQQVGAFPIDVQACHADFLIADAHKWMLGPEGIALFYCTPEQREKLRLTQFGWHMMETVGNYVTPEFIPSPTARRFEAGSPNMLGIHAMHAGLNVHSELGMEHIGRELNQRMQLLVAGLNAIPNLTMLSDTRPERLSGIITVCPTNVTPEALFEHLKQHKVFCAPRGGGIRLSPHFYTPLAQLETTLQLINDYCA